MVTIRNKRLICLITCIFILSIFAVKVYAAPAISISSNPSPLTENNLNGSIINVALSGGTFVSNLTSSQFTLGNAPSGTVIAGVIRNSDTSASLTIAYDGTDMAANQAMNVVVNRTAIMSSTTNVTSNSLLITYVAGETTRMYATTNPAILTETNINGAIITFTNPYYDFKVGGRKEDFTLMNAPNGLSVAAFSQINNRTATITLQYSGSDFDSNFTNFYVRVQAGTTTTGGGSATMISNTIPITAVIEEPVTIVATSNPIKLAENTLNGSIINMVLNADSFKTSLNSNDVQLNNSPSGLSIANVIRDSNTKARVFLSFNGADFDADITSFSITVLSSGLETSLGAASNLMTIQAMDEIEGLANYVSTGRAYPTIIEMTGYNSRDKKVYLNAKFHTDINTTGKTATFYYFIKIYDGNGTAIGSYGDISSSYSVSATAGAQDVFIQNQIVSLSQELPAAHRIVIIIERVKLD